MAAKGGFGDFTSRDQIMNAYSSIAATGRVRPEAASDAESFLEVDRASVQYGSTKVLSDLSLGLGRGEFVALL
jgi:ABC-type multidrug transport system fused ATPase/permease subunit